MTSGFPWRGGWCLRVLPCRHAAWIPIALDIIIWSKAFKLNHFFRSKFYRQSSNILVEIFSFSCSGNGTHIIPLVVNPSQSQLRWGASLSFCHCTNLLKHGFIVLQIFGLEPWQSLNKKKWCHWKQNLVSYNLKVNQTSMFLEFKHSVMYSFSSEKHQQKQSNEEKMRLLITNQLDNFLKLYELNFDWVNNHRVVSNK